MAPQRTCTDRRANIFAAPRRFELRGAARGVTASDHPLSQCGPTTATSELQTARVPSAIRHLWTNSSDMRARHERLGPASLPTAAMSASRMGLTLGAPLAWRRKPRPRRYDLINLTEDGWAQRFTDVRLHGSAGVTLEMRVYWVMLAPLRCRRTLRLLTCPWMASPSWCSLTLW